MTTTIAPARRIRRALFAAGLLLAAPLAACGGVEEDLEAVIAVGPKGVGHARAAEAVSRLAATDADAMQLLTIFGAFSPASPVGRNLLAGAVQSIAERTEDYTVALASQMVLTGQFWAEEGQTSQTPFHPQAQALAFRLLGDAAPEAAATFLAREGLSNNAPAIRRAAVASKLEELSGDSPAADLRALLDRTLDRDQVEQIADRLAELNDPVDLPRQFGFLTDWKLAGPFDHRDDQAFDATLPPEATPGAIDPAATFPTQFPDAGETVGWRAIGSDDDFGVVSVADRFENWKGSAVVLTHAFESPVTGAATVRLGTPNAFKLYLNGELLFARGEYHRGTKMDQYVIPCELAAGENLFLLKLLQNQQEQGWAQDYQIQFRVTDPTGAAIRDAKDPE